MEAVFTQTWPGPPPGATGPLAPEDFDAALLELVVGALVRGAGAVGAAGCALGTGVAVDDAGADEEDGAPELAAELPAVAEPDLLTPPW